MQRLLSIALSCLFAVTLSAQEPSITYPYNPDSNTDSLIGASDLVDFLPFYGEEFTPEPLTIEGMSVEEWMEQQTASSGGGCDFLYPDGFSGDAVVIDLLDDQYVVPNGKNLYVFSASRDGGNPTNLYINGYRHSEISISATSYQQVASPIIIKGGDVLSAIWGNTTPNEVNVFGYLADEDYFADCGGGGGVDISGLQEQIDAVAADSYAADAALLTASDNADDELQAQIDEAVSNLQEQLDSALAINENLHEQLGDMFINGYKVQDITKGELVYYTSETDAQSLQIEIPSGKNFYTQSVNDSGIGSMSISRNGIDYEFGGHGELSNIILTENDLINIQITSVGGFIDICGYLVDTSLSFNLFDIELTNDNPSYIVPSGKRMRITSASANNTCGLEITLPNGTERSTSIGSASAVPFYNSGTMFTPCFDNNYGSAKLFGFLW